MLDMAKDNLSLQRAVIGALRAAFNDHGPITPEHFDSAAKRILGQLGNAKAEGLARALGQRRWEGVSEKEHAAITSKGGRSAWSGTTKKQRSEEMSRRLALGWETRRAKKAAAEKAAKEKAARDERGAQARERNRG